MVRGGGERGGGAGVGVWLGYGGALFFAISCRKLAGFICYFLGFCFFFVVVVVVMREFRAKN